MGGGGLRQTWILHLQFARALAKTTTKIIIIFKRRMLLQIMPLCHVRADWMLGCWCGYHKSQPIGLCQSINILWSALLRNSNLIREFLLFITYDQFSSSSWCWIPPTGIGGALTPWTRVCVYRARQNRKSLSSRVRSLRCSSEGSN